MNSQKKTSFLLILALLVAGCISISPAAKAADNESGSSKEIRELLTQVKSEAKALEYDADLLASWAGGRQVSWQSHAGKLNDIKDHVNEAGQLLQKMNNERVGASAWQQTAIDRIYPLLKELADNTEAVERSPGNGVGCDCMGTMTGLLMPRSSGCTFGRSGN